MYHLIREHRNVGRFLTIYPKENILAIYPGYWYLL